jgi:hypothetical protein
MTYISASNVLKTTEKPMFFAASENASKTVLELVAP